eukprot:3558305-Amphidinium_carterae.1
MTVQPGATLVRLISLASSTHSQFWLKATLLRNECPKILYVPPSLPVPYTLSAQQLNTGSLSHNLSVEATMTKDLVDEESEITEAPPNDMAFWLIPRGVDKVGSSELIAQT